MPFPWKKTRISRLVADHLQTQKRGGSLVVETGFPTSLVDLFVKNRDRLKKPSKKKRPTSSDPAIYPSLSPLNHPEPSSTDSVSELAESRRCSTANQIDAEIVSSDVVPPTVRQNVAASGDTVVQEGVEIADANRVLVTVLKMFVVVILALGTKRFVVWITLSAFLLFFLEYVGKYFFRIYKPSSEQNMLELLTKKLLTSVPITNVTLVGEINCSKGEKEKSVVSDCSVLFESSELKASTAEIKISQQPEPNLLPSVEQVQSVRENFTPVLSLKEVMEREDDNICEISELKHRNQRRSKMAKMGSKMKKLVPKKFRISKKKRSDSKFEIGSSIEEDQCQEQEQEGQQDAEQYELESKDQSLMLSTEKSVREEEVVDAIFTSSELLREDSKATEVVVEELRRKKVGNLRYWFICLIVLAGLVGGRILALGLTLCWCLVLKSGGIPRRYIKVPMFRTSVKFYS